MLSVAFFIVMLKVIVLSVMGSNKQANEIPNYCHTSDTQNFRYKMNNLAVLVKLKLRLIKLIGTGTVWPIKIYYNACALFFKFLSIWFYSSCVYIGKVSLKNMSASVIDI